MINNKNLAQGIFEKKTTFKEDKVPSTRANLPLNSPNWACIISFCMSTLVWESAKITKRAKKKKIKQEGDSRATTS